MAPTSRGVILLALFANAAWGAVPVITTQPNAQTVTIGSRATFTVVANGSPLPTYQWQKNYVNIPGAVGSSYTTPGLTLADNSTTYDVVVQNCYGSVESKIVLLTVNNAPTISVQPVNQTVYINQQATFSVVATGTPAPTYQWQKNYVNIPGAVGSSYTTPCMTLADNNTGYDVVIKNSYGSVQSVTALVIINNAPNITVQPINQAILVGKQATFSVVATGSPAPTYQWQKNYVAIPGAVGSSYTTPCLSLTDNNTAYNVVVKNCYGTTASMAAYVTVNNAPVITTQPVSQTVFSNGRATFSVVATGTPAPTYQWQKNYVAIPGAVGASYTTPCLSSADNNTAYNVVVKNAWGTAASLAAYVTVNNAPQITAQPYNQTVTVGTKATFSVTGIGNPAPTYQWQKNFVNIQGATTPSYTTPAAILTDNGAIFTVALKNGSGAVTSSYAVLTVLNAPIIVTQPASQTVPLGHIASFNVVVTAVPAPTYQWYRGGVAIPGATSASYTLPATTMADEGAVFYVVIHNSQGTVTSANALLTLSNNYYSATSVLASQQCLAPGDSLVSHNGQYRLLVQNDGTAILQNNGATIWSTALTSVYTGSQAVVYGYAAANPTNNWSSFQDSYLATINNPPLTLNPAPMPIVLLNNPFATITGPVMGPAVPTTPRPPQGLLMQVDGDLVLYGLNGQVLWRSCTCGAGPMQLTLADNGEMIISSPTTGEEFWFSGTGAGAVAAGTKVVTQTGILPIESLHPGSMVYAFDSMNGKGNAWEPVVSIVPSSVPDIIEITTAYNDVLQATLEQLFLTRDPTSGVYSWLTAAQLTGQYLLSANGHLNPVSSVRVLHQSTPVYSLTVSNYHSFCVGPHAIIAHNKDASVSADNFADRVAHETQMAVLRDAVQEFDAFGIAILTGGRVNYEEALIGVKTLDFAWDVSQADDKEAAAMCGAAGEIMGPVAEAVCASVPAATVAQPLAPNVTVVDTPPAYTGDLPGYTVPVNDIEAINSFFYDSAFRLLPESRDDYYDIYDDPDFLFNFDPGSPGFDDYDLSDDGGGDDE